MCVRTLSTFDWVIMTVPNVHSISLYACYRNMLFIFSSSILFSKLLENLIHGYKFKIIDK